MDDGLLTEFLEMEQYLDAFLRLIEVASRSPEPRLPLVA